MSDVRVELGANSYDIIIGPGRLAELAGFIRNGGYSKKALVVTDSNVGPLYAAKVAATLRDGGLTPVVATVPAGETSKNLAQAEKLLTACIEADLDRHSPVVALGGGVVGDLAGFVAACYMRGVPFIQIPTSLLADVDSSVGGKVGVNHPLGKNLIGAFYQPDIVVIDTASLRTLPPREISTGLGEIVKYGVISDENLLSYLEDNAAAVKALDEQAVGYLINRSCAIKADVVSRDEKEGGLRKILNFGHTMAHAIEKEAGYGSYNHGEAVAIGMVGAVHISEQMRLVGAELLPRLENLLTRLGLPIRAQNCPVEAMYADIFHDKKTVGGVVSWVLTPSAGKTVVRSDIPAAVVRAAMAYCQT